MRKIVRPPAGLSPSELKELVRPVDELCSSQPENIVYVFRHNWLPGTPFYFFDMDRFDLTLEQYTRKAQDNYRTWTSKRQTDVLRIIIDIVRGLDFIHSLGFVHRDLKPNNGDTLCLNSP